MTDVVLITGGLGYIGGRVALTLQEQSNLSLRIGTRHPGRHPIDWLARTSAQIIPFDMLVDSDLDRACADVKYVVHLAALNEHECVRDPERALQVNGLGTLKLLRAAERAGVERFIYFSTAHVYGAPLVGTVTERTLPRPSHPYAITHHVAEDFVLAAHDRNALSGIVVRLSNGFGAPAHANVDRWTLIFNDLCRQAVEQGKLVLHSSGMQVRDFISLADVGRAVAHLLNLPRAACGDGLFNLGGESAIRILDVAERIARRCKVVLGEEPPLIRPQSEQTEAHPALNYCIDKLRATGFTLSGNMDWEIDATLQLSRAAFGARH